MGLGWLQELCFPPNGLCASARTLVVILEAMRRIALVVAASRAHGLRGSFAASRAHGLRVVRSASSDGDAPRLQVLVPIAHGSEEIETSCIQDTLVRAGAEVTVASVEETTEVTMSRGLKILADATVADLEPRAWDLVVCPGGMSAPASRKKAAARPPPEVTSTVGRERSGSATAKRSTPS